MNRYTALLVACLVGGAALTGVAIAETSAERSIESTELAPGESTTVTVTVSTDEPTEFEISEQFDAPFEVTPSIVDDDDASFAGAEAGQVAVRYGQLGDDPRQEATLVYEITVPADASGGQEIEIQPGDDSIGQPGTDVITVAGEENTENGEENGDESTENGEENGDENTENGEENGDESTENGDENTENGDENTENGDESTENGDESTENGDENTENGEESTENGDENTENGEESTENGDENTENGEESTENGDENTENGEESTENGDENTENGEESTENGEESSNTEESTELDVDDDDGAGFGAVLAVLSILGIALLSHRRQSG